MAAIVEKKQARSKHILVLDLVRALAMIHIILYHYFLEWYHGSFLIVPEGILANLSRLEIFKDGGFLGFIKNLFGFLFAYGFTSVNLFLVLSGFVLTLSLLKRQEQGIKVRWFSYLLKRFKRILVPFYISVLVGIGFLYLRNYLFTSLSAAPIFGLFDLLKTLFVPLLFFDIQFLQKFNGDYWFIPLILQLYLVFPLLFAAMKKFGVWKFISVVLAVTIGYRFLASYYLDSVPMGVI
jgi:peptidoglycan/LPS O-acetylase OafA/YrhL